MQGARALFELTFARTYVFEDEEDELQTFLDIPRPRTAHELQWRPYEEDYEEEESKEEGEQRWKHFYMRLIDREWQSLLTGRA